MMHQFLFLFDIKIGSLNVKYITKIEYVLFYVSP